MAKYIYSKIQPGKLLHVINKKEDIIGKRQDLIPREHFLQMASFKLNKGKKFNPHKHLVQKNDFDERLAQESWICINGSFKAILFDLDDTLLTEEILKSGDCSITLYGGHTYECLEDNTLIIETKTGPYESAERDKVFLNEKR